MNRGTPLSVFLAILVLVLAMPLHAADPNSDNYDAMLSYLTTSHIGGQALAGATGAIAVNIAAGDANLQSNTRAIVVGDFASLRLIQGQQIVASQATAPDAMHSVIDGNAFAGARGLLSINQVSGVANRESNAIAIVLASQGIEEATNQRLAATSVNPDGVTGGRPQGASSSSRRSAVVSSTAFEGSEGVVQLNQIAGMGNTAVNRLLITVELPPR